MIRFEPGPGTELKVMDRVRSGCVLKWPVWAFVSALTFLRTAALHRNKNQEGRKRRGTEGRRRRNFYLSEWFHEPRGEE